MDLRTPTTPPGRDLVASALDALPSGVSRSAAALHLALPVTVVPAIAISYHAGGYNYRGTFVPFSGDPVADAVALASAGHTAGDRYLHLGHHGGRPSLAKWLKFIASGSRTLVYGTDTLFGGPLVALEHGVPLAIACEVFSLWLEGSTPAVPGIIATQHGPVLLDGTPQSWDLRLARSTGKADGPAPEQDLLAETYDPGAWLDQATAYVSEVFGVPGNAVVLSHRSGSPMEVEIVCALPGGWEVVVPATLTDGSEAFGLSSNDIAYGPAGDAPPGFVPVGTSVWEGVTAAEHRASGIIALVSLAGAATGTDN